MLDGDTRPIADLSTEAGTIRENPVSALKAYTEQPDYEASYAFVREGRYALRLTAVTKNGRASVTDSVEVRSGVPYGIRRAGPTRVFPLAEYTMEIEVTADRDFQGVIGDRVPASFRITRMPRSTQVTELPDGRRRASFAINLDDAAVTEGDTTFLRFQVDVKKGETVRLSYKFVPPSLSPEFFLLGPLTFRESGGTGPVLYREPRRWQIASDASGVFRPDGDGTTTDWLTGGTSDTGTFWGNISDDPDAPDDDATYIDGPDNVDGSMWVALSGAPQYFAGADTVEIKARHGEYGDGDDLVTLEYQVVDGDGSANGITAETGFGLLADDVNASTVYEAVVAPSLSITGANTRGAWDGAYLRIRQAYTKLAGPDGTARGRATAVEVNVTYTPPVRYWVGGGSGTWNDGNCWAASSGAGGGAGVPGPGDWAVFDGGGLVDASMDAAVDVKGIHIQSTYTTGYTITQNSGVSITVGDGGYSQAGGTFQGGDSAIDVNGDFTVSGGTFVSTSGTLSISGDFTHSGGTFDQTSGTVRFNGVSGQALNVSATTDFYNVQLDATGVTLGADLDVDGDLTINTGSLNASASNYPSTSRGTGPAPARLLPIRAP